MNYMLMPLRRYADFNGRSRRTEFWMWFLLQLLVYAIGVGIIIALSLSAAARVAERGGVTAIERSSEDGLGGAAGTFGPQETETSLDAPSEEEARSAGDATTAEAGDGGLTYQVYSSPNFASSAEYSVDGMMFLQEVGAAFWILIGLLALWWLFTLIPTIAVSIRRLHDINKTGWLYLLNFIPLGGLVLLVMYLLPGTLGPNQYGPDPQGPDIGRTFA